METSIRDLHHREIKVRLTDADADLVEVLARRNGVPPAVLVRLFVRRALTTVPVLQHAESATGRP